MRSRVAVLTLAVFAAAAPTAEAARVGIGDMGFPFFAGQLVVFQAEAGEANDVLVRVGDTSVTVLDRSGSLRPEPVETFGACDVVSPSEARCAVPGQAITMTSLGLGDGNDRLRFGAGVPALTSISGGDGADDIATGVAAGAQRSFRWPVDGGAGDDTIRLGVSTDATANGWHVLGGAGDDVVRSLNGAVDEVLCEDGTDTLYADPFDVDVHYTQTSTTCESRPIPKL